MLANYKMGFLAQGLVIQAINLDSSLSLEEETPIIVLDATPFNQLGDGVSVKVKLTQVESQLSLAGINMSITFYDWQTKDEIYTFSGNLDKDSNNCITEVMLASEEFQFAVIDVKGTLAQVAGLGCFNGLSDYGLKNFDESLPLAQVSSGVDLFTAITEQDNTPSTLYMMFSDNFQQYMEMVRVSKALNVRLIAELDPTLSVDQAISLATELNIGDHRTRILWSPILARPINAVGLKGKKEARASGGYYVSQHMLRDANTNSNGIPPLNTPIAGFDFAVPFIGAEQRSDVVLDDPTRKRLADAKINVVQRQKYPNGVRYVIGDVLTAYNDNNSLLKVTNASDVSMFIDNRIIQIIKRHLLKSTTDTIADSLRDAKRFLESCTAKDRKLLVPSDELGGHYTLSITRNEARPHDAIDVSCAYHPDGATRIAFLNTTISK